MGKGKLSAASLKIYEAMEDLQKAHYSMTPNGFQEAQTLIFTAQEKLRDLHSRKHELTEKEQHELKLCEEHLQHIMEAQQAIQMRL
ncbi:hypothetical protein LRR81_15315 [Metabacillus sp. GX 13764]|uniref:hypothetical protein n=1 Tax=Metabacillus kandeliae TaxID=2900151 RepID=UPI001E54905F|nr:hypothetical protein [Metabacillus kandeliae]MCD7035613.1 hypothetical protein [Metabacillus kandeliae]